MNYRVIAAIVGARLFAQRRALGYACAVAAAAGMAQQREAAAAAFCCAIGIVLALAQGPSRHTHLDACEQSAPLFGRQLARGKALAACCSSGTATFAYYAAQFATGDKASATTIAVVTAAAAACAIVALCATLRSGSPRTLYVLLACLTGAGAYALTLRTPVGSLAFSVCAAMLALRQYGEALARYDPV